MPLGITMAANVFHEGWAGLDSEDADNLKKKKRVREKIHFTAFVRIQ